MEGDNLVQMEFYRKGNLSGKEVKIDYQLPSKKLSEPNLKPIDAELDKINKQIDDIKEKVPLLKVNSI